MLSREMARKSLVPPVVRFPHPPPPVQPVLPAAIPVPRPRQGDAWEQLPGSHLQGSFLDGPPVRFQGRVGASVLVRHRDAVAKKGPEQCPRSRCVFTNLSQQFFLFPRVWDPYPGLLSQRALVFPACCMQVPTRLPLQSASSRCPHARPLRTRCSEPLPVTRRDSLPSRRGRPPAQAPEPAPLALFGTGG